jgi:hypothetical protein
MNKIVTIDDGESSNIKHIIMCAIYLTSIISNITLCAVYYDDLNTHTVITPLLWLIISEMFDITLFAFVITIICKNCEKNNLCPYDYVLLHEHNHQKMKGFNIGVICVKLLWLIVGIFMLFDMSLPFFLDIYIICKIIFDFIMCMVSAIFQMD